MENKIVTDFERLMVFSNSIGKMDDLVEDLSLALEEAASHKHSKSDGGHGASSSSVRRHPRKRRGRRRRHPTDIGNFSDSSQSSIDLALKDYMENCAHQSDSDDLALAKHIARLTMPLSGNYVPSQVESDSVNESLFSPVRPQRRRKKYKSMAIDPDPGKSPHDGLTLTKPKYHRQVKLPHCSMGTSPMDGAGFLQQGKESSIEDTYPGKRKRSSRPKTEGNGGVEEQDEDNMEMGSYSQEGSSTSSTMSSSTESGEDYAHTHEADDEQSDFFHESGATCGIPGVIPWWENEQVDSQSGDESICADKQFQKILSGSFQHLSKSSQIAFKARMTKIMKHCGREIRFGRRKLKGKMPSYTVQRFIEERHKWNNIQGKLFWHGKPNNKGNPVNKSLTESKRQRKTPPPTEGLPFVGGQGDPIDDTNIGNKMLQSMGWSPGSGLGAGGCGIKTPIQATLRPRRQGLGMGEGPSETSVGSSLTSFEPIATSSGTRVKTMHAPSFVSGKTNATSIVNNAAT